MVFTGFAAGFVGVFALLLPVAWLDAARFELEPGLATAPVPPERLLVPVCPLVPEVALELPDCLTAPVEADWEAGAANALPLAAVMEYPVE